MTSTPDQWAWWRAALGGTFGPNSADDPQSGFYKSRSRNKQTGEVTHRPIAYWRNADGKLVCKLGDRLIDDLRAREQWPFVAEHPITKEVYDAVRAGGPWPHQNGAAHADRVNSTNAPDADSFDALRERIDDLAREAERLVKAGPAKSQEACDQAADLSGRLLALEKRADDKRVAEKKPHDDAAKAVQAKWRPLVERAADLKARLKAAVVTPFLAAARQQAIDAEATAIQRGEYDHKPKAAPTAGEISSVSLRTVTTAIIEDYAKTLAYFSDNAQVKELVQRLANASARAGTCPPGCRIEEKQQAA